MIKAWYIDFLASKFKNLPICCKTLICCEASLQIFDIWSSNFKKVANFNTQKFNGLLTILWFPLPKLQRTVWLSSLWELRTNCHGSQALVNDCHFGVSPVNYSDSDSESLQVLTAPHTIEWISRVIKFFRWHFRKLIWQHGDSCQKFSCPSAVLILFLNPN